MLEKLKITNYRSISTAVVELRPFTLLIGANGSGKSNLLQLLRELSEHPDGHTLRLTKHFSHLDEPSIVKLFENGTMVTARDGSPFDSETRPPSLRSVRVYSIDPVRIGASEPLTQNPEVRSDGSGAVQVLDALKTGDREDLFDKIEAALHEFVPEIEKLSFVPGQNEKLLQVRERHIKQPVRVKDLSEGTRLVLTMLTIVFQERKPSIICLEDIDRGIHPRLFGQIVEVCRGLVRELSGTQIIATTHNPYLVDQFIDDEDCVIVVEKSDASTSFTKLSDKLKGKQSEDESLGGKWYSGLVGGVPKKPLEHLPNPPERK